MDLNYKATELRLGLPGTNDLPEVNTTTTSSLTKSTKRSSSEMSQNKTDESRSSPSGKGTSSRVASCEILPQKCTTREESVAGDGLRDGLEEMFLCTIGLYSENERYDGSKHAATYEDKDGDWMLVGDVPWEMFVSSCKRLRIMKGYEARGLDL
ncbi:unnamed protein product [Lactuca virosa]|uniref:Auxin-responsive protein n=1 Tax=Lactuca virosa TaxID=75947 RepID=A0AAU9MVE6_9ASTR|nr:unnamed protein product [Lactuca virosa]